MTKERGTQIVSGGFGRDRCTNPSSFTVRMGKAENVGKVELLVDQRAPV